MNVLEEQWFSFGSCAKVTEQNCNSRLWSNSFSSVHSRCYNCGGTGHHAKECQLPPQPKKCHFCQSVSHMVASCPLKAQQQHSSPGSQGPATSWRDEEEGQNQTTLSKHFEWMTKGNCEVIHWNTANRKSYLRFYLLSDKIGVITMVLMWCVCSVEHWQSCPFFFFLCCFSALDKCLNFSQTIRLQPCSSHTYQIPVWTHLTWCVLPLAEPFKIVSIQKSCWFTTSWSIGHIQGVWKLLSGLKHQNRLDWWIGLEILDPYSTLLYQIIKDYNKYNRCRKVAGVIGSASMQH